MYIFKRLTSSWVNHWQTLEHTHWQGQFHVEHWLGYGQFPAHISGQGLGVVTFPTVGAGVGVMGAGLVLLLLSNSLLSLTRNLGISDSTRRTLGTNLRTLILGIIRRTLILGITRRTLIRGTTRLTRIRTLNLRLLQHSPSWKRYTNNRENNRIQAIFI